MAQHKQTAHEFIQSTFSPQIAVLCSNDAELLCQKNNLSFVQLVQPFCRLKTEAHIKDPNNVQHNVQHLRISMVDMNCQIPPAAAAKKLMNDAVNSEQQVMAEGSRGNVISVGDYDLQLSSSTPWFEAYRECFLQTLPPSDHEFLKHCLACIFVVSSNHTDPLAMLQTLSSSQQQQQSQFPNKLPHWFCPNILKYYVLVHDVVEAEASKAEAVYQSMKSSFGHQSCHLLQINSRSLTTVETMKMDTSLPDPWGQFLNKPIDVGEGVDYDAGGSSGADDSMFPTRLDEGAPETNNHVLDTNSHSDEGIDGLGSVTNSVMDHPLALSDESPLQSPTLEYSSDYQGSTSSLNSVQSAMSKSSSFNMQNKGQFPGHGMCLTASDQDRIRIFIHEFAVRALIPWAERQMRTLNDMLMSRTGLRKSLFGTAKKLFGGNPSKTSQAANTATTVVYSKDAPELQMRRLADIAFLFQLYDFAYQTYHTAKRDFNNDNAWLHFAGALEMASLAIFMQGSQGQRAYPDHYMESAITTYLQSCKNIPYAVRATLVSTEALKSRGKYKEAATQFIKMMSEESDLRSALLLEQAAHCFINMRNSMVRKYSFHMILAGHRFSKAGQRKHALRAYSQALQIYKGKGWSLAEDHINFTIGRQSHNLKQLENATAAFKHLLTEDSKQTAMQQNAFLREYLFVYRQLLVQESEETGLQSNTLPELPLPVLDSNATKVIVGSRPLIPQGDTIYATGVWFEDSDMPSWRWKKLEELLVLDANGGTLPLLHRPSLQLFTDGTDNKFSPVSYMKEPITIELYLVNPLKVALTLTDVTLLWSFLPNICSHEKPQLITNEQMVTAKNNLADEIVHGQVVKEIILQGNDRLPVQMTLTPQQMGELRIYGITYNLGSASTTFMAPSQGPSGPLGGAVMGSKASYVSTVYVRGKQKIEVQGPRLNTKKEEMASKVYGPDRRLDLTIHEQMPLLEVSFVDFPKTLLCGEVHPVTVHFTNTGSSPLHKLKVASSNPKCFVIGQNISNEHSSSVYNVTDKSSDSISVNCDLKVKRVIDIEIPGGILHSKSTMGIQLWIRGNDIGGNHQVDFLFYYELAENPQKRKYRILRHNVLVNTAESLSVRAVAQKACKNSKELTSTGQFLISCEMENLSQQQLGRVYVSEIRIKQISCASSRWTIDTLTSHSQKEVCIGSREMLQVCLKASMLQKEKVSNCDVTFTDLTLHDGKILSGRTPCLDFYQRSRVKLKPLEDEASQTQTPSQILAPKEKVDQFESLNSAIQLGMSLIILWQAHVVDSDGTERVCVGQHHVTVEKPDSIFTSYPYMQPPRESGPIQFIKEEVTEEEKKPDFEVLTQLVSYSLQHKTELDNCFSKCRLCCAQVTLVLHNEADSDVTVLVDTSKAQHRLNEYPDTGQTAESPAGGFSWMSQTLKQLKLLAKQTEKILLSVTFSKPGVYNINNIAVFVSYQDDSAEMTLQKQTKPSVITIRDVAS
ncbi:trafficking protein particle complex subunit 8-like isoform X2 [Ruditapes philippinarum]|uniref:trafficking protein particle complex subunit 8-like isoform X2 n=1 Tax=Ruditapes philippinarum TaxID=129788 RepID=UPI00295A7375|nr:trafficking protein particle complex subunit 8-like isoform X2 [Ruditapes philippinarum]